jgi:hypothetical protein
MNDLNVNESDAKPSGKRPESTDTLVHAMARTVGTALGTIAAGTAKLVGASGNGETSTPKGSQSKKRSASAGPSASDDKRSIRRLESYKKKKARHKQKLKRSRTKG